MPRRLEGQRRKKQKNVTYFFLPAGFFAAGFFAAGFFAAAFLAAAMVCFSIVICNDSGRLCDSAPLRRWVKAQTAR